MKEKSSVTTTRSNIMRAIKSRDTGPELTVRRMVHAMGYRYRLHRKDLPGSPDLVFPSRKKVIFVHGCFWHAHHCERGSRMPRTNRDYWKEKLSRNANRDREAAIALCELGWDVLTLWECELKQVEEIELKLLKFLGD